MIESSASLGITGITPLAEDTGNLQSPPGEKLMSQSAPAAASSSEMKAGTRRRSSVTAPVVASGEPRSSQSQRFKPTASPQNSGMLSEIIANILLILVHFLKFIFENYRQCFCFH